MMQKKRNKAEFISELKDDEKKEKENQDYIDKENIGTLLLEEQSQKDQKDLDIKNAKQWYRSSGTAIPGTANGWFCDPSELPRFQYFADLDCKCRNKGRTQCKNECTKNLLSVHLDPHTEYTNPLLLFSCNVIPSLQYHGTQLPEIVD